MGGPWKHVTFNTLVYVVMTLVVKAVKKEDRTERDDLGIFR